MPLVRSAVLSKILLSTLRITVAVVAIVALLWWFGMRMPGKNMSKAAPLSPDEVTLREELRADVQKLAGEIGERNMWHYQQLSAAADFIEDSFSRSGLNPRRDSYELRGQACHNIEVEISGSRPEILLIGAHYDSVFGSPGANDNGSGVAAMIELARLLRDLDAVGAKRIRLVFFVNEEPPYFLTEAMGSLHYGRALARRNERVVAMYSLETIGFYSSEQGSQVYPAPFGLMFPDRGDFIAFVGMMGSRALVRETMRSFRSHTSFPTIGGVAPGFIPGIAWSDHWAFAELGFQAVMVTDTALFRYPHYHRRSDTPDKVDTEKVARL